MNLVTFLATYVFVWWLLLFMVLPWGNRYAPTAGGGGEDPGAPETPRIGFKMGVVSLVSLLLCSCLYWTSPLWLPFLRQWLMHADTL